MEEELSHSFPRAPTITLKILGDRKDLRTKWLDEKNKLIRTYQLKKFLVGAFGSNIPWSIISTTKAYQVRAVNAVLTALIAMAGQGTVARTVRKMENNIFSDPGELEHDVDKIRQIIAYYDTLTVENNTKDIQLIEKLDKTKFESTGKSNLANDVETYFETIVALEEEMQSIHKMTNFANVSKCAKELSKIDILRSPMSTLRLVELTFEDFREQMKDICHTIEIQGSHEDYDRSSINSIAATPQKPGQQITMSEGQLKDILSQVARQTSSSRNTRGRSPSANSDRRRFASSKSPSRSNSQNSGGRGYNNRRDRSRSRDRSSSNGRRYNNNSTHAVEMSTQDQDSLDENAQLVLDTFMTVWDAAADK